MRESSSKTFSPEVEVVAMQREPLDFGALASSSSASEMVQRPPGGRQPHQSPTRSSLSPPRRPQTPRSPSPRLGSRGGGGGGGTRPSLHSRNPSAARSISPLPSPPPQWLPPPPPAPPIPEEARRQRIASLLHSLQLSMQTLVVFCLLALITYMTFNAGADAEHWKWLWKFASPALVLLFMFTFTSLLIHQVNCLSIIAHVWFQGGCLLLASFSAGILVASCFHSDEIDTSGFSITVIISIAILMWCVFFAGFLAAALVWWRDQRDLRGHLRAAGIQVRGAREAVAYGTFGASDDEGEVGIDGMLHGSP